VRRSYWLGPALGATVAAGFYKFIKYLEYETVLGPEDGDAPARPSGAAGTSGGAPTMTGPNTAAGTMYEEKAESKGPTMAVMGTGLGDLLTHGDPADVSEALLSEKEGLGTILTWVLFATRRLSIIPEAVYPKILSTIDWIGSKACLIGCWTPVPYLRCTAT